MSVCKKVDQNFFKKWSHDMAYIVGFFAADGTITKNTFGSEYFVLQISDIYLLELIREKLGSDHAISKRCHKKDHSIFYRLQIGNKSICEDMRNLGLREKKTFRMTVPNVPKKYHGDFIRGYFDGDGNVWVGEIHKDRKKSTLSIQSAFTSGSKKFLEEVKELLAERGLKRGSLCERKKGVYCLRYSIHDSILLYEIMYGTLKSSLFLGRKKIRFEQYITTICSGSSTG